jgi:nucleolar GTP-binding protein
MFFVCFSVLPPRSEAAAGDGDVEMDEAGGSRAPSKKRVHSSKSRSMSRGRALSLAEPNPSSGLKDATQKNKGIKMADKAQRIRNKMARIGEADRVIATKMPKHLFSGKRPKGKTDRR